MRNFIFLDSLFSLEDWFEPRFFKKPKDRFCRFEPPLMMVQQLFRYISMVSYNMGLVARTLVFGFQHSKFQSTELQRLARKLKFYL